MWTKLSRDAARQVERVGEFDLTQDLMDYAALPNQPRWSRRLGKMMKDRGIALPSGYSSVENVVEVMSNTAQRFVTTSDLDVSYEFRPEMDWTPGDYCDERSCFWKSQWQDRYGVNDSPYMATLRFHDRQSGSPVARALVGLALSNFHQESNYFYPRGFLIANTYSWNGWINPERIANWFMNMLDANNAEFAQKLKDAFGDKTLNVLSGMNYFMLTSEQFGYSCDWYVNEMPVFILRARPGYARAEVEEFVDGVGVGGIGYVRATLDVGAHKYGRCYACEGVFMQEDMIEQGHHMYCSTCADSVVMCCSCGRWLSENMHEHDGEVYCDRCFSNEFRRCTGCQEWVRAADAERVEGDDYCPDCLSRLEVHCAGCDQMVAYGNAEELTFFHLADLGLSTVLHVCDSCMTRRDSINLIGLAFREIGYLADKIKEAVEEHMGILTSDRVPMSDREGRSLFDWSVYQLGKAMLSSGIPSYGLHMRDRRAHLRAISSMLHMALGEEMSQELFDSVVHSSIGALTDLSVAAGAEWHTLPDRAFGNLWRTQVVLGYARLYDFVRECLRRVDSRLRRLEHNRDISRARSETGTVTMTMNDVPLKISDESARAIIEQLASPTVFDGRAIRLGGLGNSDSGNTIRLAEDSPTRYRTVGNQYIPEDDDPVF